MSKINKLITLATIFILLVSNLGNSLQVIAETTKPSDTKPYEETSFVSEKTEENLIVESDQPKESEETENKKNESNIEDDAESQTEDNSMSSIEAISGVNRYSYAESWEIGEGVDSYGLREWVSGNLKSYIDSALRGKTLGGNVGDKIEGIISFPSQMKIEGLTASNWNNQNTIILGGANGYYYFKNIRFSHDESIKISLSGTDTDSSRKIVIERVAISTNSIMSIGVEYSFTSKGTVSSNVGVKPINPGGVGNSIRFTINANPSTSVYFNDLTSAEQDVIKSKMQTEIASVWRNNVFTGSRSNLPTSLPSLDWEIGGFYSFDVKKTFKDISIDNGASIGGHISVINEPEVNYSESAQGFMKHSYVDGQFRLERTKKGFINTSVVIWDNIKVESSDLLFKNDKGERLLVRLDEPLVLGPIRVYSGARGPEKFEVDVNNDLSINVGEKLDEEFIRENILKSAKLDNKEIPLEDVEIQSSSIDTSEPGKKTLTVTFKENNSKFVGGTWNQLEVEKNINVDINWGDRIIFGTRQAMDSGAKPFKTASTLMLNNNSGNLSITNNAGNAADSDGNIPDGLKVDIMQSREVLNASLYSMSSSNYLTDSNKYLNHSAKGTDKVSDVVNGFPAPQRVKEGDILRAYSNVTLSDQTSAPRIRHMEGTSEYNDVKEGQNEVFYQITNNGYQVLHFNHLDSNKKFEIFTTDTQETLERKLKNKEFLTNGNYSSVEIVKFSKYPDNSIAGSTTGKIQVREKLVNGQYVFYDYEVKFEVKEDRVITADGVPTSIPLGTNFDNVSPYDLVKDVKLGNLSLAKDEYQVSVQNTVSTDTVKDKTAKVLVTYKKDTSKTLSLDVPVKVLWGNSVVFGGYDYDGSGRTTAAFTLNTESSPFITATQGGTRDDNLAIHSNFANKQYYTFNWFDLSNKKSILMTEDNMGTKYLKANGNDLKKDKLKEWGTNQIQEVNYGDIVRAWQLESNKNWLYEDEIRNSYNMRKNSVYYEITQTGYKPLFVNQANINKRTISIDETDEEIENKIEESIELPDGTNAKFIEHPSREKQGESNGIIRVSQTLASGKTIEYDYTAPFEVINDRLVVDTKEADVFLGTAINLIAPSTFIDSVKLGDQKLTDNDYKVEYVTKFDTSITGNPQVSLKITLNSDSKKFVEVTSKANVKYGSTIISRAYDTKDVDVSVSLLDNNGVPYLNANQGFGFSDYGGLLSRPSMSIYRDGEYNQILSVGYGTVKNNPKKLAEIWNQSFDKVDLEYGDVVKYSVNNYGNNTNSKGKNTWISRNESLVRETEGYYEAYYELTTSGYRLMNINQLELNNSNKVSLNTSKEEMDKNILSYINIPSHISNPQDYRMEFEIVDTSSSGKKTSTIKVYQKLQSGGEFMNTYSVNYTVDPEIEETSYDVEGNKIVETKKTSFDYGTQFKPSPTKYLEKDDNLYVYKGWLENTEELGVDVPKEGIPSPTEKESKFYYIYEKADKYINVTIPTEMVFGTFDNTEEVKSNKYEIKNNSKELTTSVTLDSFQSVSTSVKLLGENDEPDEKIDSARLNLLINDEPKIKGFNETKSDIELANIEPENKITIGINGEYYDKTSKTNIVEYNTTLKFKAISGN
ncbi:MAG: bacterial Ig-like domain-containing protein [Vagococcus sp.]|uniref:bacterial Ig-like domain-containing protein n=1 Tax=Vagococcus sp. TaxID=1933889 RepID=UPI002FCAE532